MGSNNGFHSPNLSINSERARHRLIFHCTYRLQSSGQIQRINGTLKTNKQTKSFNKISIRVYPMMDRPASFALIQPVTPPIGRIQPLPHQWNYIWRTSSTTSQAHKTAIDRTLTISSSSHYRHSRSNYGLFIKISETPSPPQFLPLVSSWSRLMILLD